MDRVPPKQKAHVARDILAAWRAIDDGVVAQTTQTRLRYWEAWETYAHTCGIDPMLQETSPVQRDVVVTAFAARVRTGHFGRKKTVKTGSVSDAIAAISKTIELAGLPSPLYRAPNKFTVPIEQCLEGMRRVDAPPVPQLAVPVELIQNMHSYCTSVQDPALLRAVTDLSTIAFYYLLRVGEYTRPRYVRKGKRWVKATWTVQFRLQDIGFFKEGKILPRSSSLQDLLAADGATLKISNQKNGRMGQVVHQEATGNRDCPVQALARRVHHLISNGAPESELICAFLTDSGKWESVTPQDMIQELRNAARRLNLKERGIDPDLIGVHSLRAGGAMALKLHGKSDTAIQKMGRWSSTTFLEYIHTQIGHISAGLSTAMSIPLPFTNIAAIEQTD